MNDMTPMTKPKKPRPRAERYDGRKAREVVLTDEADAWVKKQMGAKWSRNEVMTQVVELAMGKVSAAAAQEETVAESIVGMRNDIQALTDGIEALKRHVTTILAVLTVADKIRYSPDAAPSDFKAHKALVNETVQRIRGDEAQ